MAKVLLERILGSETLHPEDAETIRLILVDMGLTLDMLGMALADEGHTWTASERGAYERCRRHVAGLDRVKARLISEHS